MRTQKPARGIDALTCGLAAPGGGVADADAAGIAPHGPEHRNHVAADLRMGSEFYVSDHRDCVAVNLAVDTGGSQYGNRVRLYGPGDPAIPEDRNHVHRLALVGRRSENGHY
jgi:3D (Asp-Asp-Asp) domain-containing protein